MANQIPMLSGTDAAGGYLIEDAVGDPFITAIARRAAVTSLVRTETINTNKERWPVYVGRPTAAFVAEAAAKGVTGAEFTELSVDIKKIATTIMYTKELLEDARIDPRALVNPDVEAAFADLIDSHALGRNAAGTIVSQFNSELSETTQTVELGTTGDALALAVSSAMEKVEANGYSPTGVILARDGAAHMRNARMTVETATPVYTAGFGQAPDTIYGLRIAYTTNLQSFSGAAAAGRVVGLVGDFDQARLVIRKGLTVSASDQATIDVSGTLHHLFQQNKFALLWEMRVGFVAFDLNRAFCIITNAS